MKNYIQIWFATWSDGAGNRLAYAGWASKNEADAWVNSNPTGGDSTMYYFLFNKNNCINMIGFVPTFANPDGSELVPGLPLYTRDKADVLKWGIEDANFNTDVNDPASVRARATAEKILKVERGLGPKTVLTGLTTLNSLWLTYVALNNFPGTPTVIGTAKSIAKSILDFIITPLSDGTITDAEALQRYQKVVDSNPFFFKL
jgi:hypothetical protein